MNELDDSLAASVSVTVSGQATLGVTGVAISSLSPSVEPKSLKTAKWSKLKSIEIKNFKAIDTLEVFLADVTVLVGPNGCGKSSVLQAIHWAARSASYISPKYTKEVISFDRLDYLPSSEPLRMAHKSELTSETSSPSTSVQFKHLVPEGDAPLIAGVKIWAARNKGGISVHIEGGAAVTPFKQRQQFITAYIPGLAGLSEKETILVQPLLRRQAASGDAGGVLRNVLFNLASRQPGEVDDGAAVHRLSRLNQLVQNIHPGVTLEVGFDDREDVNIQASFRDARSGGSPRALEALATGVLQVVQIFAYLILFRPKILLVDEPDAHLHPDKQERLIEGLEAAAVEFEAQVILTTHSPHIVRGASANTNIAWINNGSSVGEDHETIRQLLGWGGLDKKCIFFVEDEEDQPIRALLGQWPQLYRQIAICRCFGIDNLPRNKLLEGLTAGDGLVVKALIHRDRDFMTDSECDKWKALYAAPNTFTWCTKHVDAEAYFCEPGHISSLYGVDIEIAEKWIKEAAGKVSDAKKKFFEKRKTINRSLYDDGGTPESQKLWDDAGGQSEKSVLGKRLIASLKPIVKAAGLEEKLLDRFVISNKYILAPELKTILEKVLA